MSKEWLWWLGEFGLAATVAVVAGFVTRDVPISILYGLFVGTVFFILRQQTRITSQHEQQVSEMKDEVLNLPTSLSHRKDIDPFLKSIVHSEKNELLRLAKEAEDGEIQLVARPILSTVTDIYNLAQPGDKVVSTNSGVGWGTPLFDIVRQTNFELAQKGVHLTRVFVEDTAATPEDKKRLRQEMDRQKEHLHVRFIKESRLPPEAKKNSILIYDKLFAYGSYTKIMGTGIRQSLEVANFYARRDAVEKAQQTAEALIRLSEEYK